MELHELDLNLLVIFDQLRIERRVSKVAENLDISQPAVSNSLAKLRKLLSDELFLRTPKGMEPTPYADQLAESVSAALALIHGGVNRKQQQQPASSRHTRSPTCLDRRGHLDGSSSPKPTLGARSIALKLHIVNCRGRRHAPRQCLRSQNRLLL